jgi:hypothetical protein
MHYKPSLGETVERFRSLWARESPDRVLVKIDIQNPDTPTVMNAMAKVPRFPEMVDEWEAGFELNRPVGDDNLPVVYGELGGYIVGGFLGAKVSWGAGGAYPEKLVLDMKRWRDFLRFDEENEYYRLHTSYLKYLRERSAGRFGFTEMIAIDGLNFLDCVRHGDAYTDIYDYPAETREVMDFASDLTVRLVRGQRKLVPSLEGGRFNFYQIWTPGETIFISVDAYGQCGPEVFEKFGRKYVQRLADEFGGGWLHVHSDAMRLLPAYASLGGLVAVGLEDWIKPPFAVDHLEEIRGVTGGIPLMINIDKERLLAMIGAKILPGNTLYWVSGVRSAGEANRVAEIAHGYRAPHERALH